MKSYLINGIHFEVPRNLVEIQEIFLHSLESSDVKKRINFVNPEIFLALNNNDILKQYFVESDYNFIDGIGLLMLINNERGTKYSINDRYPGTDFFNYLKKCKKVKLFLYGASPENNEIAASKISEEIVNVEVVGNVDGYSKNPKLLEMINESFADILVVCLGCPKQEYWIKENYSSINSKITIANGGAIDFWSGNVKRAPQFIIDNKLEWLYRLFQDFTIKRIKRQVRLFGFIWNMRMHKYHVEDLN